MIIEIPALLKWERGNPEPENFELTIISLVHNKQYLFVKYFQIKQLKPKS